MQHRLPSPARLVNSLLLLTSLLCAAALPLSAQQNPLNRKVSLHLHKVPLDDALFAIGRAGDFDFSYNAGILPADSLVSVDAQAEPVRKVMARVIGDAYDLRPIGNHLLIARRKASPALSILPADLNLEGFLIDAETGDRVRFATVFSDTRHTTMTDANGHYLLTMPGSTREAALHFSKRGFHDTLVVVRPDRATSLTVGLRPYPNYNVPLASREVNIVGDKMPEPELMTDWFVSETQRAMTENLPGPVLAFPIQISLVPSIGTNRLLSGGMVNNVSVNILVGYANGVRGVEIGGLVNIDRADVNGVQVAGLTNAVGGNVTGVQVGGLVNLVRGNVKGLQVAGLANVNAADVSGLQIAGLVNYAPRPVLGAQISGLVSYALGDLQSIQVSGLSSYAKGDVGGFQIGGLNSYAAGKVRSFQIGGLSSYAQGDVGGFQIGGLSSYARGNVGGFQIGGLSSFAQGDVKGLQLSGLVNKARCLRGAQIGLVNIADSSAGFQLGLVNINKKGYTAIEFSANETFQANLAYKSGRRGFYTLLNGGWRQGPRTYAFTYGAGIGSMATFNHLRIGLELSCNQVVEERVGFNDLNLLMPARASVGIRIGRMELYGGTSASLHVTNARTLTGEVRSEIGGRPFWEYEADALQLRAWMGWQAGIRLALGGEK
jgi:hypothetical protein